MSKAALASPCLLACLSLPALAQVRILTFDVRDLLFARNAAWPAEQDADLRGRRLGELATAAVRLHKAGLVTVEDQGYLVMNASPEQCTQMHQALQQLRAGKSRPIELSISMVRMPAELAAANALQDGKSRDVTAEEMAMLLRKVQESRGKLANLPDVRTRTLQIFSVPVPARGEAVSLAVHGQSFPLGDVVALHVQVREEPGKGEAAVTPPAKEPKVVCSGVLALAVGKGAVMTRVQGAEATVMWVRVLAIGAAGTPEESEGPPKSGK